MQSESAFIYDKIYAWKDYKSESETLHNLIWKNKRSPGNNLLDVACGTGQQLQFLKEFYQVEGLDYSAEMLKTARQKFPEITFYEADMSDFNLKKTFDAITCLFSSIGYLKTLDKVENALACMGRHLKKGGALIIEPWFTPDEWHPNTVHSLFIDEPDLKIARINTSFKEGNISIFDLHHLVGTPEGTRHFVEHHELGLFEIEELLELFHKTGFDVKYDPKGLENRGLYIAIKN
jgi:ubiquinone/menaquinone biosynthesis C-methylase UbiE